jgi:plasmid maintenance system antidote protein VapI
MNWNLKKRIVELYYSQSNFAEAVNVDDSTVSRVITERKQLPNEEKKRWALLLRCKPEQIFHGSGAKK